MHRVFSWRLWPLGAVMLAGLTLSGDGGSTDLVADGVLQVDPGFEIEPAPSRFAVLIQRYDSHTGAADERLDFAYLESVGSDPPGPGSLAGFAREEALHALEETLAARRVFADVLLD
jgi:hypothetical protein